MPKRKGRSTYSRFTKKRVKRAVSSVLRSRRIRRPLSLKMHNFVERTQPYQLTVAQESSATGYFRQFTWAQCLQVGNYASIFEYYKINKVVVEFRYKGASTPAYTTVPATSSGTQPSYAMEIKNEINPVLYFKVDHNDINSDSLADMKESMRTKEHQFTNDKPNFSIVLKPAIQAEAYKTALTTAYRPKWGQWLSTSDDTVPHYGLKVYAVAGLGNNTNMGSIEVNTKIYFSCKCNE